MRGRSSALGGLLVAALIAWTPLSAAAPPPYYSETPLRPADLDGKTLRELELMRATIHARANLVFLPWWLRAHFEQQSFYRPGRYDESRLTDVDRANLKTLASYTASIPERVLRKRWDALVTPRRYAGTPGPAGLAFSADGSSFVSYPAPLIFGRGGVTLWDATTGQRLAQMRWPAQLTSRGYFATPFGRRLATEAFWPRLLSTRFVGAELVVATEYHVLFGPPRAPQPRKGLLIGPNWSEDGGRDSGPDAVCIAPDGSTLLALDDFQVKSVDLRKGKALDVQSVTPTPLVREPRCTFFDSSRALVAFQRGDDNYVFDTTLRSLTRLAVPQGMGVMAPGGERLALLTPPLAGEIAIWDVRGTPKELRRLPGTRSVANAWFTPDSLKLLVAGSSGALTLFDLQTAAPVLWRGDDTFVHPQTRSMQPDSESAQLFPSLAEDAREVLERFSAPDVATAAAFSTDGTRVAIAWSSGQLEVRDARTGTRLPAFSGHTAFSDEELWEATLLGSRLGLTLEADAPQPPQDVNPLDHLAALDQPLPQSAIELLSRLDLRVLRSAIAARRGATFKSQTLRDRFTCVSWYKPDPAYTPALLTPIDRANIRAVARREAALGGPLTEAEAVKHTEFVAFTGMHDWQLLPQPREPERTGSW